MTMINSGCRNVSGNMVQAKLLKVHKALGFRGLYKIENHFFPLNLEKCFRCSRLSFALASRTI